MNIFKFYSCRMEADVLKVFACTSVRRAQEAQTVPSHIVCRLVKANQSICDYLQEVNVILNNKLSQWSCKIKAGDVTNPCICYADDITVLAS